MTLQVECLGMAVSALIKTYHIEHHTAFFCLELEQGSKLLVMASVNDIIDPLITQIETVIRGEEEHDKVERV
jgi:hypothetical protein